MNLNLPAGSLQQIVLLIVCAGEDGLGERVCHVQGCFLLSVSQTWVRAMLELVIVTIHVILFSF